MSKRNFLYKACLKLNNVYFPINNSLINQQQNKGDVMIKHLSKFIFVFLLISSTTIFA